MKKIYPSARDSSPRIHRESEAAPVLSRLFCEVPELADVFVGGIIYRNLLENA